MKASDRVLLVDVLEVAHHMRNEDDLFRETIRINSNYIEAKTAAGKAKHWFGFEKFFL